MQKKNTTDSIKSARNIIYFSNLIRSFNVCGKMQNTHTSPNVLQMYCHNKIQSTITALKNLISFNIKYDHF